MKKLIFLCFIATALLISCSTPIDTELTEEQKAVIISEVGEKVDAIQLIIMQLNFEAWTEYWSENDFISVISDIDFFDDLSVWEDSVANWWSGIESRSSASSEKRITPLTLNLALVTRTNNGSAVLKNGEKFSYIHQGTTIWKKEESGWKIINLHESVQTNPIEDDQELEEE